MVKVHAENECESVLLSGFATAHATPGHLQTRHSHSLWLGDALLQLLLLLWAHRGVARHVRVVSDATAAWGR